MRNIHSLSDWHYIFSSVPRVEDLRQLEDLIGGGDGKETFLEGKICIARYGKIYRGNKVRNCQDKGAIG